MKFDFILTLKWPQIFGGDVTNSIEPNFEKFAVKSHLPRPTYAILSIGIFVSVYIHTVPEYALKNVCIFTNVH